MDAMLVVDMQAGLLDGAPKHDLAGVVARIESLSRRIRERGGTVVRIRHCGPPGDPFARGAMGNALPALVDTNPETRPAVVKALSSALAMAKFNDPATNALFIAALVELRATETLPTIKKAFEIEAVEEELIGDYSVIEEEMAMPAGEHSERRPQHEHEHDEDCGCGHEH